MTTIRPVEKVKCVFLLDFEQMKDFMEVYGDCKGSWNTTVLYYTIAHGYPDAIEWTCSPYLLADIVDRYDLTLVKETSREQYWSCWA